MKMCYETDHCLVSSLIDYSTSRGLGKAIYMIIFQKNLWGWDDSKNLSADSVSHSL